MWKFQRVVKIFKYLKGLEFRERVDLHCKFCHDSPIFKLEDGTIETNHNDDSVFAAYPLKCAGEGHFMIIPRKCIRDIENLGKDDLETCEYI